VSDTRVVAEVMRTIAEAAPSIDVASLPRTQRFADPPLSLDSLDILQFMLDVTKRLDINLTEDEDLTRLATVGGLIERLGELTERRQT
jgi:acyl carrier protein